MSRNQTVNDHKKILISSEDDIIEVRKTIRELSGEMGFGLTDITRIVTATSELVRNIYQYAGSGFVLYSKISGDGRNGLELTFVDEGPGIVDIDQAFEEGFSTGKGLGMGLIGAKRLMDEMDISSKPGEGTTITVRKWLRNL